MLQINNLLSFYIFIYTFRNRFSFDKYKRKNKQANVSILKMLTTTLEIIYRKLRIK